MCFFDTNIMFFHSKINFVNKNSHKINKRNNTNKISDYFLSNNQ